MCIVKGPPGTELGTNVLVNEHDLLTEPPK